MSFAFKEGQRRDGESSHAYACRVIEYNPLSGIFIWKISRNGRAMAGSVAGHITFEGYRCIRLERTWPAHRLAFLMMTGQDSQHEIDHINGIRDDNRWSNLREATDAVNAQNIRTANARSTTGFLGASRCDGRFRAMIKANGKTHSLGCFGTPEEAHDAYMKAKRLLHQGCTI